MKIGPQFLKDLNKALSLRQISAGVAMLNQTEEAWSKLLPGDVHATELLILIAQWIDAGYRDYHLLDSLLIRFSAKFRQKLTLEDYVRLRMVEGFRALSADELDKAIETFDFVLTAEQDMAEEQPMTLAHFWKGRAHRKKGEYEIALKEIVLAREESQKSSDDSVFTAVIQVQESWLLFQKGLKKDALRLLSHAEAILKETDHYLARGNIESARGRIVRRSGEYAKALDHFDRAIAIYSHGNSDHRNIARVLVNAAYVKRLLALQIRKKIDVRGPKTSPKTNQDRPNQLAANSSLTLRNRYQQLCDEAIQQLRRAREIYTLHDDSRGLGTVIVNSGYLHLDSGDIDRAAREAKEAYRIGEEKNDQILMARARVLQTATENAKIEEQLGEDIDLALYANHAMEFSEEALFLAQHTQNRRLLAAAYIARGMTAANEFFQDWDLAKRCASEATDLIKAGENDHLLDELAALKSHIMHASGINDTLRGWSEGMVGDKTFQQITEEFAEIVIPKVWLREEKKISKVAESLSVSPKKVRRILRNVGWLEVSGPATARRENPKTGNR
jgi:tetratricopeptide (TPR) repeat protein